MVKVLHNKKISLKHWLKEEERVSWKLRCEATWVITNWNVLDPLPSTTQQERWRRKQLWDFRTLNMACLFLYVLSKTKGKRVWRTEVPCTIATTYSFWVLQLFDFYFNIYSANTYGHTSYIPLSDKYTIWWDLRRIIIMWHAKF